MYSLYTTPAFVLTSRPSGESNRTYWLLTRDLGLVTARAQGVRELKNRNRYALQSGVHLTVTLVRGKEGWRLTTAQHGEGHRLPASLRRVLVLIKELVPMEDRTSDVYIHVLNGQAATVRGHGDVVEVIVLLRVLSTLGYVTPINDPVIVRYLEETATFSKLEEQYVHDRRWILRAINTALRTARA